MNNRKHFYRIMLVAFAGLVGVALMLYFIWESPKNRVENSSDTNITLELEEQAIIADESDTHWVLQQLEYWEENGVSNVLCEGVCDEDSFVTRADLTVMLAWLLDISGGLQFFTDVTKDYWAFDAISACAEYDILAASGTTFSPDDYVTRETSFVLLYRACNCEATDDSSLLGEVCDADQLHSWAITPVSSLLSCGILSCNDDAEILPGESITRAELINLVFLIDQQLGWKDLLKQNELQDCYWEQHGVTVSVQMIDDEYWLLLPSCADLTQFTLKTSDCNSTIILAGMDCTDCNLEELFPVDSQGKYVIELGRTEGGVATSYQVNVIKSENICAIFLTSDDIDSYGRSYVDAMKGNSSTGSMRMLDESGNMIYDASLSQIKSRGNSTFSYEKKSYQIKLTQKSDLLGNGEAVKTWVLLAEYADSSLFRDKLCKDLAIDLGMTYTTDCDWVDLYYDGEYRGTYLLSEKVQISSTGIDIQDLEKLYQQCNDNYGEAVIISEGENAYGNTIVYTENLTDPKDISSGYLLELNNTKGNESNWFVTSQSIGVNVKSPEYLSKNALCYISELYQEFEDAVYAQDGDGNYTGIHPETGKAFYEYCDLNSLVQMYLLYFFSDNRDAYCQSTYFYMTEGMLYAGPVWDSDQTFGVSWSSVREANNELYRTYLVEALTQIPAFQTAVAEYYTAIFRDMALDYATAVTSCYTSTLLSAERMNHVLWATYYVTSNLTKTSAATATYTELTSQLSLWMQDRIAYMDEKFNCW